MYRNHKQGSGLLIVLIISTALGIGVYSTIHLVSGEFQRNKKALAYHEAKQAAESLLEVAQADLENRADRARYFSVNALAPYNRPLYIPQEFVDRYSQSDSGSYLVIPSKTAHTSKSEFGTFPTEIIGGAISPYELITVDKLIPGNESDPAPNAPTLQRSIELLSKATVSRPRVGDTTVYARQIMQVRDIPFFSYAIFYNLPLEIAPGPKMEVYGNIHGNHDAYFQSGSGLDIYSSISIAGDLYHGRHPDSGMSSSQGAVQIINGSGELVNMKADDSWPASSAEAFEDTWLTSKSSDFYEFSSQIWDENVQTSSHGISTQQPVGMTDYIEDTDPDTAAKESFNSAYNMIQPVLQASELAIPAPIESDGEITNTAEIAEAAAKNEVESQKYAYNAGLTIQVDPTSGALRYFTYERNGDDLQYDGDGKPKIIELTPPSSIASYNTFNEEDVSDDDDDDADMEVTHGIYDKRQDLELDTVELDVGALKDLLHAETPEDWGSDSTQNPTNWWNGVVYVDFPTEEATSSRPDGVNPAKNDSALLVKNGGVIPNPEFKYKDETNPVYGMTLATNQMMYVQGHYNADGDRDTGSATSPDDPSTFATQGHEAPAALVGDSITFLSANWDPAKSTADSVNDRQAKDTEVSAAILTGLVPSGESGSSSYSGGVENFPRFLEKWSGKSFRMRGSIVALFESEVGTERWGHGNVYSPPKRDWGFHSKFAEGYQPPGSLNNRQYNSVNFQLLTKAEFETHVERIKTYF